MLLEEAPHQPQVRATLEELEGRFAGRSRRCCLPEAAGGSTRRRHRVLHPAEGLEREPFTEELVAVLLAYPKR